MLSTRSAMQQEDCVKTLTRKGPTLRTELLTLSRVLAFKRCIDGNPLFKDAVAEMSRRSTHPTKCWYLRYLPVNPQSLERIVQVANEDRLGRARAEGPLYTWVLSEYQDEPVWKVLTLSGSVYRVWIDGTFCECMDFTERCRPAGIMCKHLHALAEGLGSFHTSNGDTCARIHRNVDQETGEVLDA